MATGTRSGGDFASVVGAVNAAGMLKCVAITVACSAETKTRPRKLGGFRHHQVAYEVLPPAGPPYAELKTPGAGSTKS
jgi:hypothetical protein